MSLELTIIVLLVTGLALMALEAVVPSFGILGIGGVASFIAAIMMLRNMDNFLGIVVDGPLLASLGIAGAAVLAVCAWFVCVAWKARKEAGAEALIGMIATVLQWDGTHGRVRVDGEEWAATGPEDIKAGDYVKVAARNKLLLTIARES